MVRDEFFLPAFVIAVTLFVLCSTPHKSLIVVRNHVFLKLFALLDLPPWFCRLIVPKTWARDNGRVVSFDDFVISPRDGRKIPYRLYIPHTERCKADVIVWVHGGGFVLGSITEFQIDRVCRMLAWKSDSRVLSLEYRKSPEYSLLAGRTDIEEGLVSASQNYSRVVLGGESAGATIALSVAVQYPDLIKHLFLAYPVLEKGIDCEKLTDAWIIDASVFKWFTSHAGTMRGLENVTEQSVMRELFRMHDDRLSRLPPTHIISAGLDALQIGSINLERKLRRARVDVVHDSYLESDHGFLSFGIDQSEAGIENASRQICHTLQREQNVSSKC